MSDSKQLTIGRIRFSLSRQLYAALLLPLALQLLLFSGHAFLLGRSESLLETESQVSTTLEHINWLSTQVSQRALFSLQYSVTRNDAYARLRDHTLEMMQEELTYLKHSQSQGGAETSAMMDVMETAQALGGSCDALTRKTTDSFQTTQPCPLLRDNILKFEFAHQAIVKLEKEKLRQLRIQMPQAQRDLRALIVAGVLLNIFLAIFLVRFTAAKIVRRLTALSNEALEMERLHSGRVNRASKYGDELDELQSVFKSMASVINLSVARLREESRTDSLTRLPNRRWLMENLDAHVALARRNSTVLAVAILDIDHFKSVNDKHGHEIGDLVLKSIAATMMSVMRKSDLVARWGGEEFIIVMPQTHLTGAIDALEKLRQEIACKDVVSVGSVTVSAGVTEFRPTKTTFESCLQNADAALYQAKREGRNRIVQSPRVA